MWRVLDFADEGVSLGWEVISRLLVHQLENLASCAFGWVAVIDWDCWGFICLLLANLFCFHNWEFRVTWVENLVWKLKIPDFFPKWSQGLNLNWKHNSADHRRDLCWRSKKNTFLICNNLALELETDILKLFLTGSLMDYIFWCWWWHSWWQRQWRW